MGIKLGKVEEVNHDELEKQTTWMPIFLVSLSCTIAFLGSIFLR